MLTVSRREAELTGTTEACLPPGTALEHAFLEQRFWSVVGKERSNTGKPDPNQASPWAELLTSSQMDLLVELLRRPGLLYGGGGTVACLCSPPP